MPSLLAVLLAQAPLCPPGWEPLEENACLRRGARPGVVVYLHGMLPPEPSRFARELELLSPAAARASVPVIALRGEPGLCDWSSEYTTWWCWPSSRAKGAAVSALGLRLEAAVKAAARRLERPLPPPLIAGYSNGGYFASLLMEAPVSASGYAVLHAGLVTGVTLPERPKPVLLVAAEGDGVQRPGMEAFRATLEQARWTPAFVLRKNAHPLEPEDFDHLMGFATRLGWRAPAHER